MKIRNFFRLSCSISTIHITVCAALLAIAIIFSGLASVAHIIIFPSVPFLKVEIVDFCFLIAYRVLGIVYASLILILTIAIRFAFDPNVIGLFALLLCDFCFLWFYFLSDNFLRGLIFKLNNKKHRITDKRMLETITVIGSLIFTIVMTSFFAILINWAFILKMYFEYYHYPLTLLPQYKADLITIFLPFNLIKYIINGAVFASLYFVLPILVLKLNLKTYVVTHPMFYDLFHKT